MAQLDARKEVLAAKQELINDAFNQALDMLFNLDSAAYLEILRRMLLSSIKTGEEVIILSPRGIRAESLMISGMSLTGSLPPPGT